MKETREKILEFIENKGISSREFCRNISVSPNYFSLKGAVQSDVMIKIYSIYPELNFDWLITGRGEMLITKSAAECLKCAEIEKLYNQLLKDYKALSDKTVMLQDEQVQYLKKQQLVK